MKNKSQSPRSLLLKKFSATAAAFIAAQGLASGQVVINDPVDDTLALFGSINTLEIDINNDGTNDIEFFIQEVESTNIVTSTITFTSQTPNGSIITQTTTTMLTYFYTFRTYGVDKPTGASLQILTQNNYAGALSTSVAIRMNSTFQNPKKILLYTYFMSGSAITNKGYFNAGEEKFLGVKFYENSQPHIAWFRIKILGNEKMVIQKWAFEQTADTIVIGTQPYLLKAVDSSGSTAQIAIRPKFNCTINYVVLEGNQPAPDWQQIINGQDGNSNPALIANSLVITNAPDTNIINLSGLTPNTQYKFYMVSQDLQGHQDKDVFSCSFTTKSGTSTIIGPQNINNIRLYPNPAHNYFTIQGLTDNTTHIKIIDLSGKTIKTANINHKQQLDISDLKNGIYNVQIISNKQIINKRLIKY